MMFSDDKQPLVINKNSCDNTSLFLHATNQVTDPAISLIKIANSRAMTWVADFKFELNTESTMLFFLYTSYFKAM